jgi:hypothetical protein
MNPNPQNGNSYPQAAQPRGRVKVVFEVNTPRAITIERDPPEYPTEGNWGEQWQYFLAGNEIAWVEPEVHNQLIALGAAHGKTFTVTKTKVGRANKWVVMPGDVAEQAARAISAPAPAPRPAQRAEAPAPAPEPAPQTTPRSHVSGNVMQAALCSAIDATHRAEEYAESTGASYRASSEDVRALAITIYIEVTGSNGKGRR